jgi:hypothetical protein
MESRDLRFGRGRIVLIVGVAVLLLASLGGLALLTHSDDPPIDQAAGSDVVTGDRSDQPEVADASAAAGSSDLSTKAVPPERSPAEVEDAPRTTKKSAAPKREERAAPETVTCWNGEKVEPASGSCRLSPYDEDLLRFAFPVDWSACEASPRTPWNALSYDCYLEGAKIHVATYADRAGRLDRLRDYGYPGCATAPGGRMTCGPSDSGRYVRTYENPRLRLYISTDGEWADVLRSLPQRPAADLLTGTP